MKKHADSVYRLAPKGSVRSLLHVRSAGSYIVPAGWRDTRAQKFFLELFWCVRGELDFCCEETHWRLKENEVCFHLPGDFHQISAYSGPTEYFWLTIDGPDLPDLIESFGITRASRTAGACPVPLFHRLTHELRDWSPAGEFKAGAAGYEILSLAFAGNTTDSDPVFREFRSYVERRFAEPDAGIEDCARELRLHRSTLMRLVKHHCGISPMDYLLSRRMQEALRLLYDTTLSVKEISLRCGFSCPNYFAKAVFRRFGKNPSDMRHSS